ncbi:MAG: carboxymuconolactone decarboxylase family protein [Actinomycetia bacterium]|nr:carboxymuconolactone decarboxylase family protein [Actinomycetes bacterium]
MSGRRLPPLPPDQLSPEARELYDAIAGGRRSGTRAGSLTEPDGSLIGPFNPLLYAPPIGDAVQKLGDALRFDAELDDALLEIAVLTVAKHWTAQFEWWAHARLAQAAGVDDAIIEALRTGADPPWSDDRQQIVHQFARQTLEHHDVDDETWTATHAALGDQQIVELISLIGYYGLISANLNVFRAPMPAGVAEPLA